MLLKKKNWCKRKNSQIVQVCCNTIKKIALYNWKFFLKNFSQIIISKTLSEFLKVKKTKICSWNFYYKTKIQIYFVWNHWMYLPFVWSQHPGDGILKIWLKKKTNCYNVCCFKFNVLTHTHCQCTGAFEFIDCIPTSQLDFAHIFIADARHYTIIQRPEQEFALYRHSYSLPNLSYMIIRMESKFRWKSYEYMIDSII